ncbi:MAG TPA: DUF2505 domain-containing protein [Nevskiaceae bacterium]|nr:DUF2505 domain-containing protein [Nevskiaceae bacterium]
MQTFTNEQRYDQPVAHVLARYTDTAFLTKKYAALGRQDIAVLEQKVTPQQARLRMTYSDSAGMELPDFAKKLMPERTQVVQSVTWDLVKQVGEIEVESKGSPVTIKGRMQLKDDGKGGCTNTITWNVSCSIPLLGGKVEKLLVEGLGRKARQDEAVSRQLLAE